MRISSRRASWEIPTLALAAHLAACSPAVVTTATKPMPAPTPTPRGADAPTPAEPPPFDPWALIPTRAAAAISYDGANLRDEWPGGLVRAAVDAHAPTFALTFGLACRMVPMQRIDRLDVDVRHLGDLPEPDVIAVFQLDPQYPPKQVPACVQNNRSQRLQAANGIMTFAWSPERSPVVFAHTKPETFLAAASPVGSLRRFGEALHRGLEVRKSAALAALVELVAPNAVAWIALAGGDHASDAQTALGIRPRSLLAWATFAESLTVTARLRLDSAAEATKVASLLQGHVRTLGNFEELEIIARDVDVVLRLGMTEEQARIFGEALGVVPAKPGEVGR